MIVGAQYLTFVILHGMRLFAVLVGIVVCAAVGLAMWTSALFSADDWTTGTLLVIFAPLLRLNAKAVDERSHTQGSTD